MDRRNERLLKSVNFIGAADQFRSIYTGEPRPGSAPALGFPFPLDDSVLYLVTGSRLFVLLTAMILCMIRKRSLYAEKGGGVRSGDFTD
jgi:hypothetical protein